MTAVSFSEAQLLLDQRLPTTLLSRGLLLFQGIFYLVMGLWPLISVESFQSVTGPKTDHLPSGLEADHWLVMTVAVLIVAISLPMLMAALRRNLQFEVTVLALGAAIGLTAIDILYVSRLVIAPIYLLDAAVESICILGWIFLLIRYPSSCRSRNTRALG